MIRHHTLIHLSVLSCISLPFCIKWRQRGRERKEGKLERSLPYITCSLLLRFCPSLASVSTSLNSPQWRVRDPLRICEELCRAGKQVPSQPDCVSARKIFSRETWHSVIPGLSLHLEFPLLCRDTELQTPMKVSTYCCVDTVLQRTNLSTLFQVSLNSYQRAASHCRHRGPMLDHKWWVFPPPAVSLLCLHICGLIWNSALAPYCDKRLT